MQKSYKAMSLLVPKSTKIVQGPYKDIVRPAETELNSGHTDEDQNLERAPVQVKSAKLAFINVRNC